MRIDLIAQLGRDAGQAVVLEKTAAMPGWLRGIGGALGGIVNAPRAMFRRPLRAAASAAGIYGGQHVIRNAYEDAASRAATDPDRWSVNPFVPFMGRPSE